MDTLDLVKENVAYNQWANLKIIEWLRQQPEEVYDKTVISSFKSINKLMHHIMETEQYYFAIIQERTEQYEKEMTTKKVFEELMEIDTALLEWLSQQSPSFMSRTISLKRSPFLETYTIATLVTHLVNHSTYHRGQLIALRHQLDLSTAPKIDYYRYIVGLTLNAGK